MPTLGVLCDHVRICRFVPEACKYGDLFRLALEQVFILTGRVKSD
jgi:hypothetical protein